MNLQKNPRPVYSPPLQTAALFFPLISSFTTLMCRQPAGFLTRLCERLEADNLSAGAAGAAVSFPQHKTVCIIKG